MHLKAIRFHNFRRLSDTVLDLDPAISILVGANNSGKTSASQAFQLFLERGSDAFTVYDLSVSCWSQIDAYGDADDTSPQTLPSIQVDLWFSVDATSLHRVIALLPSLKWTGTLVGIRLEFGAADPQATRQRFQEARAEADRHAKHDEKGNVLYAPSPRKLMDYLKEQLSHEFEVRAFVLDPASCDNYQPKAGYQPALLIVDKDRTGRAVLSKLIKIDMLSAQRHLADGGEGGRSEDLSRRLSRFYKRNLEQRGTDYAAVSTLAESERQFKAHLDRVFEETLKSIETIGYPGLGHPRLQIEPDLNPEALMRAATGARVHYALDGATATLPDRYNGLGFKNLIYIVVELLDIHKQWLAIPEDRPPIHLVFIEEPEAHLHAQLQQVFIRQVLKILAVDAALAAHAHSQVVVTTHSAHVVYEYGFQAIRYFRREAAGALQKSTILNLSLFKTPEPAARDFLVRYLKLTHCDLFFADAAILVEGNVERLLMPAMIAMASPRLAAAHLSILEIGGAFAHKFQPLIEFLGLKCLVVTDIDSVGDDGPCSPDDANAVSVNATLANWLPKKAKIADLLKTTSADCTEHSNETGAAAHVCFQRSVTLAGDKKSEIVTPRTFEDAFALANHDWCQHADQGDLHLRIANADGLTRRQVAEKVAERVRKGSFKKTDFAVALLTRPPGSWQSAAYILDGLAWLESVATPQPGRLSEAVPAGKAS